MSLFCGTQKQMFSRMSKLLSSIQWKWMGTKCCRAPKATKHYASIIKVVHMICQVF